jgi:hypothetical protein
MFNGRGKDIRQKAVMLGWAGAGLGLAELLAPRAVAQLMGLQASPATRGVLRVLGVREIVQAVGLACDTESDENIESGIWTRVAGDVLDAALLAVAATQTRRPMRFALVAGAVSAVAAMDLLTATEMTEHRSRSRSWWPPRSMRG